MFFDLLFDNQYFNFLPLYLEYTDAKQFSLQGISYSEVCL